MFYDNAANIFWPQQTFATCSKHTIDNGCDDGDNAAMNKYLTLFEQNHWLTPQNKGPSLQMLSGVSRYLQTFM